MLGRRRSSDPFAGFVDVAEIGRGAFATVHRAVDRATGQPVALKVLHGIGGRRGDLRALQQEARALGAVSAHPHIVTLHRVVLHGDADPILVMELCRGSLADRLARTGPLTVRESVAIGVKLAGALETAHRAGVLHRDLKPSNVLLTVWDEPVLADFGIAGLREGTASGEGRASGLTVHHAAPEVLLGDGATARSDVYGLASVMHELLTGHPPFYVVEGEDAAAVQRRIMADPPPRLSAPGASPELRDLLRRALAKDPRDRPRSALAFARELRALEVDHGWPPTPCRVTGDPDALDRPDPDARAHGGGTRARDASEAARTRSGRDRRDRDRGGVPHLGLAHRSFDEVVPEDRDLEPVPTQDHQLLPGRDATLYDPVEVAAAQAAAAAERAAREAAEHAAAREAGERERRELTADGEGQGAEVDVGYRWRVDGRRDRSRGDR